MSKKAVELFESAEEYYKFFRVCTLNIPDMITYKKIHNITMYDTEHFVKGHWYDLNEAYTERILGTVLQHNKEYGVAQLEWIYDCPSVLSPDIHKSLIRGTLP